MNLFEAGLGYERVFPLFPIMDFKLKGGVKYFDRQGVIDRCARCKAFGDDFEMEFRVVHPDGSIHWLYDRGRTFLDADGRPQTMTGACVDITDRKSAEAALRASESFYRQTLESVPGMTFTAREDGQADYLSEQVAAFTGAPVGDFLGGNWIAALHPDVLLVAMGVPRVSGARPRSGWKVLTKSRWSPRSTLLSRTDSEVRKLKPCVSRLPKPAVTAAPSVSRS